MVVGCQPYAPPTFTPRKFSWYSFLLEAESNPRAIVRSEGFYVNENSTDTSWDRTSDLPERRYTCRILMWKLLSTWTRTLRIPEIVLEWQGREDGSWTDLVQYRTQMRMLVPRVCCTPGDGPFPWDFRSLRGGMGWVEARVGLGSQKLTSALFWYFTQRRMVVCCRRFGIDYGAYRQWSSLTLGPWVGPLTMEPIGCPESLF